MHTIYDDEQNAIFTAKREQLKGIKIALSKSGLKTKILKAGYYN